MHERGLKRKSLCQFCFSERNEERKSWFRFASIAKIVVLIFAVNVTLLCLDACLTCMTERCFHETVPSWLVGRFLIDRVLCCCVLIPIIPSCSVNFSKLYYNKNWPKFLFLTHYSPVIAFLYPLKALENLKIFWRFQGVWKSNTGL